MKYGLLLAYVSGENIIPAGGMAAVNLVKKPVEDLEAQKAAAVEKIIGFFPTVAEGLSDPALLFYVT